MSVFFVTSHTLRWKHSNNLTSSFCAVLMVQPLNSHVEVVFFVLQCQVIVPQLLSPVVDELAGDSVDLPAADEELERELMGREEVEPPVAIEVPAPGEPTNDERRHHRLTHLPYQPWCNVCVRGRGREN